MKLKKIFTAVLMSAFFMSAVSMNVFAAETDRTKFDKYTIMDVTHIQKCVVGLEPTLQSDIDEFDYNKSGDLDVMDATYLQKRLVESANPDIQPTESQPTEPQPTETYFTDGTTEVTEPTTDPTDPTDTSTDATEYTTVPTEPASSDVTEPTEENPTEAKTPEVFIEEDFVEISVGEAVVLSAHADDNEYFFNSTWESSNPYVATIEEVSINQGKVVAKSKGTTTITFQTNNGLKATCVVTVSGTVAKCLDVSTWQGDIDFNRVKEAGYNYVIIRAGYGNETSQKDDKFEANYKKAKAAGLKVGAYWFSYAMSPGEAVEEARACLYCLGNKTFDMPIYYDIEYAPALSLGNTTLTNIAINFCENVKSKGHQVGVYASMSVFDKSHTINYDRLVNDYGYSIWNAEWGNTCSIACDMWQYTDRFRVNGISTDVDCSYIYNLNIVK